MSRVYTKLRYFNTDQDFFYREIQIIIIKRILKVATWKELLLVVVIISSTFVLLVKVNDIYK